MIGAEIGAYVTRAGDDMVTLRYSGLSIYGSTAAPDPFHAKYASTAKFFVDGRFAATTYGKSP